MEKYCILHDANTWCMQNRASGEILFRAETLEMLLARFEEWLKKEAA